MKRFAIACVSLAVALAAAPSALAQKADVRVKAGKDLRVRGKIVRVQGTDRFVVRTQDNRDVTFYAGEQTRFFVNGKPARFADFKVGTEVNAVYTTRDDRYYLNSVVVGEEIAPPVKEEAPPAAEGTSVQGTVVRVVGSDQVIVKTEDNKEVTIYVAPQTKYVFDERPARFQDLRPGSDIRVQYDVRDRRNVARGIFGLRRAKNR